MRLFLFPLLLIVSYFAQGQSIEQIAAGENYTKQAYYNLATDESTQIPHDSWDLAFTAMGLQDAGIHINESSELSDGEEASSVLLYLAPTHDFDTPIIFDEHFMPLLNSEENWHGGAANVIRDVNNPFDYGWGIYDPTTNEVIGNKVYVIKLRDNSYKKFIVESLIESVYSIRYADLDGANEYSSIINKSHFLDSGLALFSFNTGEVLNIGKYDLSFSRYSTLAVNPTDETDTLEYIVTGIMSAPNVEIVEIRNIMTSEVNKTHATNFSEELHVIGHDWKTFAFLDGWVITENLSYIVKTEEDKLYKIVLIDFEGASTGVATFEKTCLITTVVKTIDRIKNIAIFPNPTQDQLTISYDLKNAQERISLNVYNSLGQIAWQATTTGNAGLNARTINLSPLAAGQYVLHIETKEGIATQKIQIN